MKCKIRTCRPRSQGLGTTNAFGDVETLGLTRCLSLVIVMTVTHFFSVGPGRGPETSRGKIKMYYTDSKQLRGSAFFIEKENNN